MELLDPPTSRADVVPLQSARRGNGFLYRLRGRLRVHSDLIAQEDAPSARADLPTSAIAPRGTQTRQLRASLGKFSVESASASSETSYVGILSDLRRNGIWGTGLSAAVPLTLRMLPVWGMVSISVGVFVFFTVVLPVAAYCLAKSHGTV
ncbi:hypothetical protein ACIA98_41900 [Streptomyces sp. NPDC051366]|uniref:hypothetical protein n=1 Tax=Streptomyces sp. NPDC051366 TaxID=3365652 RepID=UPI0037A1AD0A